MSDGNAWNTYLTAFAVEKSGGVPQSSGADAQTATSTTSQLSVGDVIVSKTLSVGGNIIATKINVKDVSVGKMIVNDVNAGRMIVNDISAGKMIVNDMKTGNIIPSLDNTYDIGSPTHKIRNLFVSDETIFIGKGEDETVKTIISGGDPGYGETSKFISEIALCIIKEFDKLNKNKGILTPIECTGDLLVDKLKNAGLKFE